MSALPNLPPKPDSPRLVPRRRWVPLWQRVALYVLAIAATLTALLTAGVISLLHSQKLHQYVLAEVRQRTSEALGVPVEVQNFELSFDGLSPTVDLYGVVVHGAAPFHDAPLLQLEHGKIGVRVVSLFRRAWYLDQVTVHHVIVQVRVDAEGNSNLPKPKQSQSQSRGMQPLFDLAIHHALLDGGELYYNDRKLSLDADMQGLMLNAAFDSARQAYGGQVGYSAGHLKANGVAQISHALSATFQITASHLELREAELRSGKSVVKLSASVDDFDNPRGSAVYHASLDTTELRQLIAGTELASGVLRLDGHAEYLPSPQRTALESTTLHGTLRSDSLEFRTPDLRIGANAIRSSYSLVNGDAEVHSLAASLLGGTVNGHAEIRHLSGEQQGVAHINVSGVSLARLKQLAKSSATSGVTLAGTMQGSSDARWKGALRNLLATADVTLDAAVGPAQSNGASVPVVGEIHGSFESSTQQLSLRQSSLRAGRTLLTLNGTTGQSSQMHVELKAADLHEVEVLASLFSTPGKPLDLHGTADFEGTVVGPASMPRFSGELRGSTLQVRGTSWKSLHAHLEISPAAASISSGEVVPLSTSGEARGEMRFHGSTVLDHWRFQDNNKFQGELFARGLDISQLARLGGEATAVSGVLNANIQVHGTPQAPIGEGHVEVLHATVAGETIQSASLQLQATGDAAHANLKVTMPAGVTSAVVTYSPKTHLYEAQLETRNFKLDQLQSIKGHGLSISGAMDLIASGRGSLDDPQLTADLEIPQLHANGQSLDRIAIKALVEKHLATLTLDTRAAGASVHGQAEVKLTGDYEANAVLDTQVIQLQPLVAAYAPSLAENITGHTELHATVKGPLKHRELMGVHIVVPEVNARYQNSIELATSNPIHTDYANGVLTVQRSGVKGTGTDLQFQGSLPLLDRTKPVALLLLGSVDLRVAQLFTPDLTSTGQLRFDINSFGARSDPNIQGVVQIVNANIAIADMPLGLANGNGTLTLTRDRLSITEFAGTVGGGRVTARGGVVYHPSLQFDIALNGQAIRMLYPEGMRESLSANLALTGAPDHAVLRGQVNVDQLSFSPDFDLSSLTSLSNGVEEPPSRGFLNDLQLNVGLRSSQNVNLSSRNVSVAGSANLRVTGSAAQPVLLGRVNLTGGDLVFQGNRYVLQNGVIDFVNPSRTEANVNAALNTTIQQYNIGMRFEGSLDRLRTSYSSDPALPPADIINLIAFGKTQEAANALATPTNLSAEQSIASAVSGQVTSRVEKIAGISHLSIDPTLGNNQQNAGATVTVQQRVTSKIFVTFSTDVTSTQRQVIQLEYQATPRVSVSGTRDQNGGFGFDTRITREW